MLFLQSRLSFSSGTGLQRKNAECKCPTQTLLIAAARWWFFFFFFFCRQQYKRKENIGGKSSTISCSQFSCEMKLTHSQMATSSWWIRWLPNSTADYKTNTQADPASHLIILRRRPFYEKYSHSFIRLPFKKCNSIKRPRCFFEQRCIFFWTPPSSPPATAPPSISDAVKFPLQHLSLLLMSCQLWSNIKAHSSAAGVVVWQLAQPIG